MATPTRAPRPSPPRRPSPAQSGLPDPRPVTDYTVAVSDSDDATLVTVTLDQPCIIRAPAWGFIDCDDGSRISAPMVSVPDNRTIVFVFPGGLPPSVGVIEVPYQDMQVQNPQGGFVRPGGKWFRAPS